MNANDYQAHTGKTAIYPGHGTGTLEGIIYLSLKLNGEAGEIAEKIGKLMRDMQRGVSDGIDDVPAEWLWALEKELGDCLWYISQIATELGADLGGVMEQNIAKLADRKARGVLGGSGDDR
jgi:NTP pyrophosphatase (non-canonical NTP hydrolase)